jgi:fatty acid-binding protein DegV
MIRSKYKVKDIIINHIGPVIGAHSGPGTIALFFLAQHR